MRVTAATGSLDRHVTDMALCGVFEDGGSLRARLPLGQTATRHLLPLLESLKFRGATGQCVVLPSHGAVRARWIGIVGLGTQGLFTLEGARRYSGMGLQAAQQHHLTRLAVHVPAHKQWTLEQLSQAVTEGIWLSQYRFTAYKPPKPEDKRGVNRAVVVAPTTRDARAVQRGVRMGTTIAQATNLVRDLCNHPANVATPTYLADQARIVARQHRMRCRSYSTRELKRMRMGGILSVAQGSAQPPQFVVMEHAPSTSPSQQQPTIVFVGKGITFDSGGISIKPSAKMDQMKYDMSGAAAVIGIMQVVGALKLPCRVIGMFAAAENLPSGTATKPGDIITTHAGKTVEVLNTDAEGRMVLSDCLSYAQQYHADAVVDFATLTGACVVALGRFAIGMLGTDAALLKRFREAGELSGERVWELPLWSDYTEDMRGQITDLKNISGRGEAGAITAAAFLKEFTAYPWVHLDIAGTAWAEHATAIQPIGSTGVGVRLAIQVLRSWIDGAA